MGLDETPEPVPPKLADETRWYTKHTALRISSLTWSFLGAAARLCVGCEADAA